MMIGEPRPGAVQESRDRARRIVGQETHIDRRAE